jgi:hypothetical protein
MDADCPTCKSLWDELSQATQGYFAILSKSQLAQLEHNTELIKELEAPKLAAQERRGKARRELRQHEANHPKANGQTA